MNEPGRPASEQVLNAWLAGVLRAGVWLSAAVVALGAIVYLSRHVSEPMDYSVFRGEPVTYRSTAGLLEGLRALQGRAIVQLGLFILMATPVARVVTAAIGFAHARDWLYVTVTAIVLLLLTYSLLKL